MARDIKNIFNYTPKYDEAGYKKEKYEEDLYKVKKVPYSKDDMKRFNQLFLVKNYKKSHFGASKRTIDYASQKDQLVTFKMSYSSKMNVHKAYLSTYMPQENKDYVEEKPVLFGTDDEEYEENMTDMHYKCIISPENQEVNLKVLCSSFMRRMEVLTGFTFYWKGVIHEDTEHRHAHICINGKDKRGKNVYFQPEMIARTMRETLSYVATLMVGERTDREIQISKENLVRAKRWTKLDEELEKYPGKISVRNLDMQVRNRLSFLTSIGLAKRKIEYYELNSNWKETLLATGRFNTYLNEYNDHNGNLELFTGGSIAGKVEKVINFDKDESWNDALIIKVDEKNYYVPVAQLKKDDLEGKIVYINSAQTEELRKVRNSEIKILKKKKNEIKHD